LAKGALAGLSAAAREDPERGVHARPRGVLPSRRLREGLLERRGVEEQREPRALRRVGRRGEGLRECVVRLRRVRAREGAGREPAEDEEARRPVDEGGEEALRLGAGSREEDAQRAEDL